MGRRTTDAENHIGRRIKLRDMQILLSVAKLGSMAKAAAALSTTQPTVSQAIAELEEAVGARLFERSTQGVMPTVYGEIFRKSAVEAFDTLTQGLRDIEHLATPGAGEVWIGAAEFSLHGFVPAIIQSLAKKAPAMVVHAADVNSAEGEFQLLRERKLDLMIGRGPRVLPDDLQIEHLFEEGFCVVASADSAWARRRNVALKDLVNESWIFGEPSNVTQTLISGVFRNQGLELPPVRVYTTSMNLRLALLTSGGYVACLPKSILRYGSKGRGLKVLSVDMKLSMPVSIVTVKARTQSAVTTMFIEQARQTAKAMGPDISSG
jgi:DNA-binding transcriptional LysR family regulator